MPLQNSGPKTEHHTRDLFDEVHSSHQADGSLWRHQYLAGGVAMLFPGWLGVGVVFLTRFFMSLKFPTSFALGIKEVGPNTKLSGSVIVM